MSENQVNVFAGVDWDYIESLNEELCERANAQHGKTSDGFEDSKMFVFLRKL